MPFAQNYEAVIAWIVDHCPSTDKFAHTYVGLAIWLGAAVVLRRPLHSWAPLAVVVVAEVANECVDRLAHGGWFWHDTLQDAFFTWFWPVVLGLALRKFPHLRRAK
jgi:hypothetical protein